MFERIGSYCVSLLDPLLGWMLYLPSDIRLLLVAGISALILVLLRLLVTDQDLLERAANDRRRLNQLIRQARAAKDKATVKRCAATKTMVRLKTARSEMYALIVVLAPVAMLAAWCFARLAYHPPAADEWVDITAYTPVSAVGEVMHIVPRDGLSSEQWVVEILPDEAADPSAAGQSVANGVARWKIKGQTAQEPYTLGFRYKDKTFEHSLLVGERARQNQIMIRHTPQWITHVELRPVKLLGIVPGVPRLMLPAWLIGYLILVIPLNLILKKLLGVY